MTNASPFPFWTSDQPITYTELQKFCKARYAERAHSLIAEVSKSLHTYPEITTAQVRLETLLRLNELSLELSCLNAIWNDFSVAVFEVVMLPKQSIVWEATYMRDSFNATLRVLADESRIKESVPH